MPTDPITAILQQLHAGQITVADAAARIASLRSLTLPARPASGVTEDAHVDLDRSRRCGFPEVVFCEGKTPEAVVGIFETLHAHGEPCFGTRMSPEQIDAVRRRFPEAVHNPIARTVRVGEKRCQEPFPDGPPVEMVPDTFFPRVAVITAGTSDRPVAEEALETLRWMGCDTELIVDVGVAGPHRLPENLHRLDGAAAVVVVAGMEGALPSVVGGWVDCPVIAVPTSVGYGANFGGVSALLGMLNSCAANVTVVNIDAGFKGGYVAGLIALRQQRKSAGGR
jgi:pyridinium-3,5-biscarboxylic acid mononucleotide synthase